MLGKQLGSLVGITSKLTNQINMANLTKHDCLVWLI